MNFTGRVIDARQGTSSYTQGEGSLRSFELYPVVDKSSQRPVFDTQPIQMDIPNVRARSISRADQFTADLLPTING